MLTLSPARNPKPYAKFRVTPFIFNIEINALPLGASLGATNSKHCSGLPSPSLLEGEPVAYCVGDEVGFTGFTGREEVRKGMADGCSTVGAKDGMELWPEG